MRHSARYRVIASATAIASNCAPCDAGDPPNLYCCRLAKHWRSSCVKKISPASKLVKDIGAPWYLPTIRGCRRDDGAAWRSAAIAPNRPRTATGSRASIDKVINSSSGATGGKRGGSSSDCLRCQRNTSRSWNDGANLRANLWRQERHAPMVRQPHSVFRGADRGRLLHSIYRFGSAVMKMLADTRGVKIGDEDKRELRDKFSTMRPHPDVQGALSKLHAAGFRLFTLTNNIIEVQARQMEYAGIEHFFERLFSVDTVKRHKPAPQTYAQVEKELGVKPSELCMIACHTWDTFV